MTKSIKLNEQFLQYAIIGGSILGGGGGGPRDSGLAAGRVAVEYGALELVDIMDIPDDTVIITASAVGAPAAPDKYVLPKDYVKAVRLFEENTGVKVGGIITNENGGTATVNGWIQASILGIPLIDAPCNGRAHPTGTMGSMGLNNVEEYVSYQAAVGGNPELGNYLECFFKGTIANTSKMVRQASIVAGGLVAVARNPVPAAYVKKNGALHGISHAIDTGRAFHEGLVKSPKDAVLSATEFLKGEIITEGRIEELNLNTTGGFDVGTVRVGDYELTLWNEYMTLEKKGERLATFPDLIMTFDKITGMPATSAEIRQGQEITVIAVDRENLRLGSGMRDRKLMEEIEPIIAKDIIRYIF